MIRHSSKSYVASMDHTRHGSALTLLPVPMQRCKKFRLHSVGPQNAALKRLIIQLKLRESTPNRSPQVESSVIGCNVVNVDLITLLSTVERYQVAVSKFIGIMYHI